MASGKKGAKGNKTAHVLNLLTAPGGGASAPADEAQESAPSPEAVQPAPSRPLVPPILEVAQANDENLAQQIQQALEEELLPPEPAPAPPAGEPVPPPPPPPPEPPAPAEPEAPPAVPEAEAAVPAPPQEIPAAPAESPDLEAALAQALEAELLAEEGAQPPAPAQEEGGFEETVFPDLSQPESASESEPVSETEPAPEPGPAPEAEPVPETAPAPEAESAPETEPAPETESAPEAEPVSEAASAKPEPAPAPNPADELGYINVIQSLVEEKAPRYIEMFGLCPCPRCKIDVVALTLNNLVPKYVVMKKHDMIPMLTVYEGRFNSTIFAQLTRACKIVSDHPRHTPEDLAAIGK